MAKTSDTPHSRAMKTQRAAAAVVSALARLPKARLERAVGLLFGRQEKIICIGVGKSGFIGMKTAATLTSLGHDAVFLHPVEALHGDTGSVREGDVIIAFSFSGNSREVTKIVGYLQRQFNVTVIAITGAARSPLAQLADVALITPVKKEGSPHELAPMASTTAALVLGDMLAAALVDPEQFSPEHFARHHPGGSLGLSLTPVSALMKTGEEMPLVAADAPLVAALRTITEKRLGVVGVIGSRGKLTGVITDGDVRRFFETHQSARGKRARDAMTKRPKTIKKNDSLKDALSLMEEYKITSLFVMDGNQTPCGILHMHNVVEEGLS